MITSKINPKPTPIDDRVYPYAMQHRTGVVVLFYAPGSGVVIHPGVSDRTVGKHSTTWTWPGRLSGWTPFYGDITLTLINQQPTPTQETQDVVYPCAMQHKTGFVVLFHAHGAGVVIHQGASNYTVGTHQHHRRRVIFRAERPRQLPLVQDPPQMTSAWTPFYGDVTLTFKP